jgi:starch phosphorylase
MRKTHTFKVEVFSNDLDPHAVRVELYADGINGGNPVGVEMKSARPLPDADGHCIYRAAAPVTRPAGDYTPRLIPHRAGVAVPLESSRILWQR